MIRIKQGSRWVRSTHTEYITILAALFDRIIMAVGNGDMKTPPKKTVWDGHNLLTHMLCHKEIETPQGAMQQTSHMLPKG